MFLRIDKRPADAVAAIEETGKRITYSELIDISKEWFAHVNRRTLVFILSENTIGSIIGYVSSLNNRVVPLILGSSIDRQLLSNLITLYQPSFLWVPLKMVEEFEYSKLFSVFDYCLLETGAKGFPMYSDLALLLPTSGSTGSPKLVRHSYKNVEENAKNVAEAFEIKNTDRAIAILPIQYTMGLSVVSSYMYAGGTLLLVNGSLTDGSFWKFIKEQKATSFTGVPYSFEILQKLRFFRMDLPDLKLINQGGGKLTADLFKTLANYAADSGRRFIASYGQTEATARMAYLPAEMALEKVCSIGRAIPNGRLVLLGSDGKEILEPEIEGELVYTGPNVTLGYALKCEDLLKADEFKGVLRTGDIAKRDKDGYYYIVGRLSRFLKLYGLRIGLDEVEQMVKAAFEIDCICTGDDTKMKVSITNDQMTESVRQFIEEKTGLYHMAFEVVYLPQIKRNDYGKIIYQ